MMAVEATLNEIAQRMFVGPVWPASILVCLMIAYSLIAVIGLIDLDLDAPEIDLDASIDIDAPDLDAVDFDVSGDADFGNASGLDFLTGFASATVRWTNFGRVPLIIWVGVFAMVFWSVSYGIWHGFDSGQYSPTLIPSVLLCIRNFVVSVIATKFITQPVVGKFTPEPGYDKERLLGATCEISSLNASPTFGQAKFRTNAAPLLLNVRTDGPKIPKGTEVRIIDFDPSKRIYTVSEIQPEIES